MGVHGLTTYLRENRRTLSTTLQLSLSNKSDAPTTTIVVDAWSFIYALYYQSGLPWIYGGETDKFAAVVTQVVSAWRAVGLVPILVFDGPSPPAKFETTINRENAGRIKPSEIFFRTSAAGRAAPHFLSDSQLRMLPPLVHAACIRALLRADVVCHFADSEGDAFAVELAGILGAYVVGLDSDFVILRPGRDGYLGYIPLDEMTWAYPPPPSSDDPVEDGFVPMKSPKGRSRRKSTHLLGSGLIPTAAYDGLNVIVYTPDVLASQLRIPVALLPVLAAFVGCDFSSFQRQFFDRGLTLSQRITRTAQTIQALVTPASRRGKAPSTVMDLVNTAIATLSIRTLDSAEQESIAHTIVDAILQYSILDFAGELWPTPDCLLHHPSECALLQALNTSSRTAEQKATLHEYIGAFRTGQLAPEVMDILFSTTYWPTIFFENPDLDSTTKYIGRPIRRFMYAVLNHDVGIVDPDLAAPKEPHALSGDYSGAGSSTLSGMSSALDEDSSMSEGDFASSPTDSVASDSVASSFAQLTASNTSASTSTGLPTVKEYVRRAQHVGVQDVTVPSLEDLMASSQSILDTELPDAVHARPEPARMAILLTALQSDTKLIQALDADAVVPVIILRSVLKTMASRPSPSERWQRHEAQAFLASCMSTALPAGTADQFVPEPRCVQLVAQILSAFEATLHLGQVLFLSDIVGDAITRFSGQRFHTRLALKCGAADAGDRFDACWKACIDGLVDVFAGEAKKSPRKEKKKLQLQAGSVPAGGARAKSGAKSPVSAGRSMFAVLADMPDSPTKRRIETDVMKLLMSDYEVSLVDDSMQEFHVRFFGPPETPFAGGEWKIHVELPDQYPYKSPSIGFLNKIFHPNIDELSGSVCLDVINQTWSPMFDMINIFEVFLPQLLRYPNPNDPLNGEAAALLMRHPQEYEAKVKDYVKRFATKEAADAASGKKEDDDEDEEMEEMSDAGSYGSDDEALDMEH